MHILQAKTTVTGLSMPNIASVSPLVTQGLIRLSFPRMKTWANLVSYIGKTHKRIAFWELVMQDNAFKKRTYSSSCQNNKKIKYHLAFSNKPYK